MATLPKHAKVDDECSGNYILLDDLWTKIIQNVPLVQWPYLELVSIQFRRCVQHAYRTLKTLDLKKVFLPVFGRNLNRWNKQFFTKLISFCPLLQGISGFDCLLDKISSDQLDLLAELTNLTCVDFKSVTVQINDLSRFLKKFPRMKSLELHYIRLNDEHLDFFGNINGLMKLTIGTNIYSQELGSCFSTINAENLTVLDFSKSYFESTYLTALLNRSVNLEALYLYDPAYHFGRNLIGLELQVLQCLPNLMKLRKFELQIMDMGIGHVSRSFVKYTSDELMGVLVRCINLRKIRVRFVAVEMVTDNFLHRLIAECPLLEALAFNTNHCKAEEMLSNVVHLQHLTHLVITNNKGAILRRLLSQLDKLANLSHLTIHEHVNEPEFMLLSNLQSLASFCSNGWITEGVARSWIKGDILKKLTFLAVNISNGVGKVLFENTPYLQEIIVSGEIDDETLLTVGECCKYLQTLDIEHYSRITEKGLLNLLVSSSTLQCLNVDEHFYPRVSKNILFKQFKHVFSFHLPYIESRLHSKENF